MNFAVIDFIFIVVILLFAILGVVKGFIDNIFGKLSWILGIIVAFFFYKRVSTNFLSGISNKIVANVLAFLILFVIVFIIVKMIQVILNRIFDNDVLNSLDRALGFLFGIVEGFAVVALVIFLLCNQPFFSIDNLFDKSFFFNIFNKFISNVNIGALAEYV